MHTKVHEGRNIKRIREILGIKQEALAVDLGEDWTQKKVSLLEQKEEIDAPLLEQVAKALKVSVEAIKNFDEDAAVNIVSNTFTDFKDNSSAINQNCVMNFNLIDKVMELFERLLASEKEKTDLMKEILEKMKK